MSENENDAKAILAQVPYITLATVGPDGLPWNTPVYAAFDEAYRFFWVSARQARHSQNIRGNNQAAIVVYDSTVPPGTGKGLYIEARADELTDAEEIAHALVALKNRGWATAPSVQEMLETSARPSRAYAAVSQRMWISADETVNGYQVDARAEIHLLGE